MVGRANKYDYKRAADALSSMYADGIISGGEMMMIKPYYENIDAVTNKYLSSGVPYPVIHCEKDIGEMLSVYSAGRINGDSDEGLIREAMRLFYVNCKTGERLGSSRMVLHLWGGVTSDSAVVGNIGFLPELVRIAGECGIKLLIENVPCTTNDPLDNWRAAREVTKDTGFIFDSRFGAFHHDTDLILESELAPLVEHIHISDFVGFDGTHERDFSRLRPILHPREGKVDFDSLALRLDELGYNGSFTVESPVMSESGIDEAKMRDTVTKTKQIFNILS